MSALKSFTQCINMRGGGLQGARWRSCIVSLQIWLLSKLLLIYLDFAFCIFQRVEEVDTRLSSGWFGLWNERCECTGNIRDSKEIVFHSYFVFSFFSLKNNSALSKLKNTKTLQPQGPSHMWKYRYCYLFFSTFPSCTVVQALPQSHQREAPHLCKFRPLKVFQGEKIKGEKHAPKLLFLFPCPGQTRTAANWESQRYRALLYTNSRCWDQLWCSPKDALLAASGGWLHKALCHPSAAGNTLGCFWTVTETKGLKPLRKE